MIKVEFYGLYRLDFKTANWETEAKNLSELLAKVSEAFPVHSAKELKNSVIFVNGVNFLTLKKFHTKLKDGDEVFIMSPASGG